MHLFFFINELLNEKVLSYNLIYTLKIYFFNNYFDIILDNLF